MPRKPADPNSPRKPRASKAPAGKREYYLEGDTDKTLSTRTFEKEGDAVIEAVKTGKRYAVIIWHTAEVALDKDGKASVIIKAVE